MKEYNELVPAWLHRSVCRLCPFVPMWVIAVCHHQASRAPFIPDDSSGTPSFCTPLFQSFPRPPEYKKNKRYFGMSIFWSESSPASITRRWGGQTDRNGRWSSRIKGGINYSIDTLVGGQKGSLIVSINIFIGRRQQWTIPVNRNHFGALFICKPRLWSTEVRVEHVISWGTNWLHFRHMIFKYLPQKFIGVAWLGSSSDSGLRHPNRIINNTRKTIYWSRKEKGERLNV